MDKKGKISGYKHCAGHDPVNSKKKVKIEKKIMKKLKLSPSEEILKVKIERGKN